MIMKWGFTGTRNPIPRVQEEAFVRLLTVAGRYGDVLHHGDCVGADEVAHITAQGLGLGVVVHPPNVETHRAHSPGGHLLPPLPYLERNKNIVASTFRLLALPGSSQEELRSGTWATVRYAKQMGRMVIIVWPDGRTEVTQ